MNITLTTTIDIPDSVLEDVLTTAVEGGINYWASLVNTERREDLRVREAAILDVADGEVGEYFLLTGERMALGVERLAAAIGRDIHPNSEVGGQFLELIYDNDLDAADATLADAIVQMACFGELVYG
jgi:hypothetical protein